MSKRELPAPTAYRHRRVGMLIALAMLASYFAVDVVRSAGPSAVVARCVWLVVLAAAAALQREARPSVADAAARLVGLLSGVCATFIVSAYGGPHDIYFGFLLGTSFCVLVLVPELPSAAVLAGLATTAGGAALLVLDGGKPSVLLEWVALSAALNSLAGWGTINYARLHRRELEARQARAEAILELRASNERFEAAFSSTSLGALILAMDGTIVAANAAVHAQLGEDELVGRSYFDLLMPEDAELAATIPAKLASGLQPPRVERRFVTRSGEVMLGSVHTAPVRDRNGVVEHAIVMIEDITERRMLRERLAKSERLAALGTLAAGMAHEINNPLSYVKSNLCWMRERLGSPAVDGDELAAVLAETERGAERIAWIVGELSTYARARVDPVPTAVAAVVEDALRLVSARIEPIARISVELAPDLPIVSAVGRHLSQALVNLLANAADAIERRVEREPAAARRILVKAAIEQQRVAISVEDSGHGIPEAARARLFEPFFTTKGPSGTGLGLAISRENLSRFGATMDVERSALGGARFVVRVACAARVANDLASSSRSAA